MSLEIGILWCGNFNRSGLVNKINIRPLRFAYRAPSLFLSRMRAAGNDIRFLYCDEDLRLADLDGSARTLQNEVDILYITTHGSFAPAGYEAFLDTQNWSPGVTGIGSSKLSVALFDTCELIDGTQNWQTIWSSAKLGRNLRVLLGFDGLAAIDRGSAGRGAAFADNLVNGQTFADAWINAVRSTSSSQFSKAVAIGIGDTQADAKSVLTTSTLNSPPGPRTGSQAFFEAKY